MNMVTAYPSQRTLVMGILNITEDSFSDGGLWLDSSDAFHHAQQMISDGADLVDIGAESTRPGAVRVDETIEKQRVLSAVQKLVESNPHIPLSIDTTRSSVAQAALEAGAHIINDVSGGQMDKRLPHIVADSDCLYIVQHWRTWLTGSQDLSSPDADTSVYKNGVIQDVYDEVMHQVDAVLSAKVKPEQIVIDPGLGFSKPGIELNMPLIAALEKFRKSGYPVLIGTSRKRFISHMGDDIAWGETTMDDRDAFTAALSALCAERGVWAVRVHDVRSNVAAVRAAEILAQYE